MNPPTIYKRSIDHKFRCVVRTVAGQPVHRDIYRRAETGDMLPPPVR